VQILHAIITHSATCYTAYKSTRKTYNTKTTCTNCRPDYKPTRFETCSRHKKLNQIIKKRVFLWFMLHDHKFCNHVYCIWDIILKSAISVTWYITRGLNIWVRYDYWYYKNNMGFCSFYRNVTNSICVINNKTFLIG